MDVAYLVLKRHYSGKRSMSIFKVNIAVKSFIPAIAECLIKQDFFSAIFVFSFKNEYEKIAINRIANL